MARRPIPVAMVLLFAAGCVSVQIPKARIVNTQAQEDFTWKRAAELALAHHPDLLKSRAQLNASLHNRNQALGGYLPSVDASLSRRKIRSGADSLDLDLDVSQPLFSGFKITGDALQAWRQWEAARWAYVEQSATVRQALRNSFVELMRLRQLLDTDQKIAQRRQDNAEMIRLRYEAGRENQGSSLRAQAIAQEAAFDVRQIQRRIESQSLAFGKQLGGYFTIPIPVAGDLEQLLPAEPALPDDYTALAEDTPSVKRLVRTAEATKAAILSSQSSLWPSVTGDFSYSNSGSKVSDLEDQSSLGLTVSIPLFHGGQNVEGVFEANADYRATVQAARSERDSQIAALSSRWSDFRDAREFVEVRRSFLEAARQRAEIVRAQYTTGLSSFQDFDIAEQELADSEKAYVESLADVLTKEANWQFAQGQTLEEVVNAQ